MENSVENTENTVVFSPDTITITNLEGEKTVIDMTQKPVLNHISAHEHEFVLDEPDPYVPHLTGVVCKICGVGRLLKTGDIFKEKDILKEDGKIETRKSPLTSKEKVLSKKYQENISVADTVE